MDFTVQPHLLSLPPGAKVRLKVQLFPAGESQELWSVQYDVQVGPRAAIPIELPLPNEEGAYDVLLSVAKSSGWTEAVRRPLAWNKTIVERKAQLLVLDPRAPAGNPRARREFSPLLEIDPS